MNIEFFNDEQTATDAALYVARFYEDAERYFYAVKFYVRAAKGGNSEALQKLREFRYRIWIYLNPVLWFATMNMRGKYKKNCECYQPIELSWEKK